MNNFFGMLARMKYINRWGLMRNTKTENIAEHSLEVAIIAHALAVIGNTYFGKELDAEHIIPQNLFNFTNPTDKEFQICWSLKNLRPLEKIANRSRPKDGRDISEELKQQILNS